MAIGESNPDSPRAPNPDRKESVVDVSQYQKLDDRQLSALLSQYRISVSADSTPEEKIRKLLDQHVANGQKLVGSGTLQILPDGFGFLRSRWFNYLSGPDDIYVSPSQIRKFDLVNGAEVEGHIRPPKENERYFALLRVSKVNGMAPEAAAQVTDFEDLHSLPPKKKINLDGRDVGSWSRVTDLVAPLGFGQRTVIASPPRAGKTRMLTELCEAVQKNHPDIYTFVMLVNLRPEEVESLQDRLDSDNCEVIGLEFGESESRNHDVAMMVLEKAKRKVETGLDALIFLDSLTDLAKIELGANYNKNWLESGALKDTFTFLRSAKRTDSSGSLTLVTTLKVDTDNKLDNAIADALLAAANMEVRLDRELVKRRIWPAINIHESQTQQEEALLGEDYRAVCKLRRLLGEDSPSDAMEKLLDMMNSSESNNELLRHVIDLD